MMQGGWQRSTGHYTKPLPSMVWYHGNRVTLLAECGGTCSAEGTALGGGDGNKFGGIVHARKIRLWKHARISLHVADARTNTNNLDAPP